MTGDDGRHVVPAGIAVPAGLVLAIAALTGMVVEWVAAAMSTAPYSMIEQAASDLGVTTCGPLTYTDPPVEVCSPAHAWVNGVWIVAGLAIAVTVLLLHRWFRNGGRRRSGSWAVLLLAAAALLQSAVGAVPVDADLALHTVLALVGFLAQNAGLILAGAALSGRHRLLGVTAVLGGVIGMASLGLFVAPTAWNLPLGLIERISMYPYPLWLAAAGVVTAARRGR
ncbi:DUF998 domain-containing protein [Kocuria coralli]|nr:DUF998 domain-containing protein [Kocuria coralli]